MPCVNWVANGPVPAGFVSRFQMSYPSAYFPNRQFAAQQAWQVAMQHLQAQQMPLPPGSVQFSPFPASHSEEPPRLLMVQIEQPTVQRASVNAPFSQPVGNAGGQLAPPPVAMPKDRVGQQAGPGFEQLHESALPANADPAFGEADAFGGTFTDIDISGNETPRDPNLVRVAGPNPRGPR